MVDPPQPGIPPGPPREEMEVEEAGAVEMVGPEEVQQVGKSLKDATVDALPEMPEALAWALGKVANIIATAPAWTARLARQIVTGSPPPDHRYPRLHDTAELIVARLLRLAEARLARGCVCFVTIAAPRPGGA